MTWQEIREAVLARAAADCEVCRGKVTDAPADHPSVPAAAVAGLVVLSADEHARWHAEGRDMP